MAAFNPNPFWVKVTKTYADLAAAALTNDIEVYSLPGKAVVHNVVLKHSASFTGGTIASYTLSVGVTGTLAKFLAASNVFTAPGATVIYPASSATAITASAVSISDTPVSVRLAATSTVGNLSAATAGSVDIWILVSVLP